MNTELPAGYAIVKLNERFYPMSYTFKEDGTPVLAACYWVNGMPASYVRRTLAIVYLRQLTAPPAPAPKKKTRKKEE
jgi:hypothetical protein